MKKNLLFVALLSVLAFACNKPDNGGGSKDVVMPDPATKNVAKVVEFKTNELPKYEKSNVLYDVLSVEFTEGSRYIMKCRVTEVKSPKIGDIEILVGGYTESNGSYNMNGVGTLNVSSDNKTVEWKPAGSENQGNQKTTEASVKKVTTNSPDASNISRTWKVDDCLVKVQGSDFSIKKTFTGLNLEEIAKYASENGVNQLKNKLDRFVGYNVSNVIFTGDNTLCIAFTGANGIEGSYNMNTASKTFTYSFSDSSNSFFHGNGNGTYDFPADKKATVVMNVNLEGYSGSLEMNMSQVN